jgi:hypothetical protein
MSKIIQFLETVGRNPRMTAQQYSHAVDLLDLDAPQREALLQRDHAALNTLLGGRAAQMMMMLFPVEDSPQRDDEQKDDDDKKDEESIRRH